MSADYVISRRVYIMNHMRCGRMFHFHSIQMCLLISVAGSTKKWQPKMPGRDQASIL
jgi:hypothetical protein